MFHSVFILGSQSQVLFKRKIVVFMMLNVNKTYNICHSQTNRYISTDPGVCTHVFENNIWNLKGASVQFIQSFVTSDF